jgi:hypothetical protein
MSDDETNQGRDRATVAGREEYEVRHFSKKRGLTIKQTQELIDRGGKSREALDRVAEMLKGRP